MKKMTIGILAVAMIGLLITGCAPEEGNNQSTDKKNEKIQMVGSTSVEPLVQKLLTEYKHKNTNAEITVQAVGSGAGIEAAINGTADIGMSSRDLSEDEKSKGIKETVIAKDGIAVAVNPENKVEDLTVEQIKDIYMGKINNWKEVGGDDAEIIVVSREDGSGTRTAFEELLKIEVTKNNKKASGLRADALVAEGNGSIQENVKTKKYAIGYVSMGNVNDKIKPLKVNGVEATVENILNNTYIISRPFLFVTKGEPNTASKAFIDFILSEDGKKIVETEKYITLK